MAVKKVPRKPASAINSNAQKTFIEKMTTNQKYAAGAFVALCAMYIGYLMNATIYYLEPSDPRLKEVFFGQEPWLVMCTNSSTDPVFEAVSRKETSINFGVLDCSAPLPSQKTTFQRLKMNEMVAQPAMFFSGYGRDPKQLPAKLLRNQYVLRKEITALTKLHAVKIKDTTNLYKRCLKKGNCALVLAGGEMDARAIDAVNKGAAANPNFRWVILDSNQYKLRKPSEKDIGLRKYQGTGHHRLLLLGENDGSDNAKLASLPFLGDFDEDNVEAFVNVFNQSSSTDFKQIDSEALAIMKRKLQHQYRAPVSSPTVNPEATILPTAMQEEQRRLAEARRAEREQARRAEMDAEGADFIEYDEEDEEEDEEDEDDDDDEEDEDDEMILD